MNAALPGNALPPDVANNPVLSRWLRLTADGMIELYAGKVELGQGIGTTQLQIAADELDVPLASIRLCVGNTASCPDQGLTAGSLSTEVGGMALRLICAEVRQHFVNEAARRFGVAPEAVSVAEGRFFPTAALPGDVSFDYHALAASIDLDCHASGLARPKPYQDRRVAGMAVQRPDLRRKLFGAGFIHDMELPGMLHGRMVRPPSYGAKLESFNEAARQAILALPGVRNLLVDGRYIGVCAQREEQAIAAANAISRAALWTETETLPQEREDQGWIRNVDSEASIVDERHATTTPNIGSASTEVHNSAAHTLAADYSRPFLSHASIGPSCALAQWDNGRLTVWTHAQGSFALRRELAELLDVPAEDITVIHADGAGCYGHNGADDAALDAAMMARAAGHPVRLQWSREDELSWAPFGSAMSIHIEAALDAQGRIAQWRHATWSQTHVQRPGIMPGLYGLAAAHREPPAPTPEVREFPLPAGGGQRNAIPLYDTASRTIEYHLVKKPVLRSSALRALGGFANVFAIESFMDELAHLAGKDPLEFRLAHLSDPRAIAVLKAVAEASNWHQPLPPASRDGALRGRGIGFARYKNSSAYCAVVIEVEVTDRIVLDRIWTVVDAGEVVNPDGLINQMEGGILQAASWTLKEAVHFDAMRVTTRSWDDYPILRFDEVPRELHVHIVPHPELPPLGAGECAAGPTAAAIANALHNAIGVRVRNLPLTPERLAKAVLG
ncbi:MAG: xanthine dehydrogenase family protein molybdopterin-binding subunit [Herminiimonas sp.]|nr:xanthine dehydrogenase family protein molybdopterin-binding subunit [Herminiimonas sp.]